MSTNYKNEIYVDDFLTNTHNRKGVLLKKVKGKVIHGTANFGINANAKANKRYFQTTDRYASSQEITDEKMILRAMKSNEVAWHVGATRYTELGNLIMKGGGGYNPNYFLIGEEICVHKNGNFKDTLINSLISSINLMKEYNFTEEQIYRHYDITGKACPSFMLNDDEFIEYKQRVRYLYSKVFGTSPILGTPPVIPERMTVKVIGDLNVRKGPGIEFDRDRTLQNGDEVTCYELVNDYFHIGDDFWIHSKFVVESNRPLFSKEVIDSTDIDEIYIVKSEPFALIHRDPDASSDILQKADFEEKIKVLSVINDWAKTQYGYIHMTDLRPSQVRTIIRLTDEDRIYTSPFNDKLFKLLGMKNPAAVIMDEIKVDDVVYKVIKGIEQGNLMYLKK